MFGSRVDNFGLITTMVLACTRSVAWPLIRVKSKRQSEEPRMRALLLVLTEPRTYLRESLVVAKSYAHVLIGDYPRALYRFSEVL